MQKSSFFNSVNGDRKYKAEEWAEYFSSFIGNGVFPNPSINLMINAGSNMAVVVMAGKAWINGYFYHNTNDLAIPLDTADGILKRIDRIVVQLRFAERKIELAVKKGVNASSPTPPAIQRDADIYELALADVYIGNGVINISQANITDLRYNTDLCGIVTQTVKTIDTSQLAAQLETWFSDYQKRSNTEYLTLVAFFESLKLQGGNDLTTLQAWFLEYQTRATAEFTEWFSGLQDILNDNTETHILDMLTTLNARVTMLESVIFNDITANPFLILFDNLDGIKAGGVWNANLQRIEC